MSGEENPATPPARLPSVPGHPSELPVWHIQDVLDKVQGEVKAMQTTQIEHAHELRQHKESLNAGNAKFSALEAKIVPRWSTIITVIGAAAAVIWAAARYPDPQKFEDLSMKVQQMEIANVNVLSGVADQKKATERLEGKVDRLLERLLTKP